MWQEFTRKLIRIQGFTLTKLIDNSNLGQTKNTFRFLVESWGSKLTASVQVADISGEISGNLFDSHSGENNKTPKLQVFALKFVILSPGWESNPRMAVLQTAALTTSPPGLLYAILYHLKLTKPSKYAMISRIPTLHAGMVELVGEKLWESFKPGLKQ